MIGQKSNSGVGKDYLRDQGAAKQSCKTHCEPRDLGQGGVSHHVSAKDRTLTDSPDFGIMHIPFFVHTLDNEPHDLMRGGDTY